MDSLRISGCSACVVEWSDLLGCSALFVWGTIHIVCKSILNRGFLLTLLRTFRICYVDMICRRVGCRCLLGLLFVYTGICLFDILRSFCISIALPILLHYNLSIPMVSHSPGILLFDNTCTSRAFGLLLVVFLSF